MIAALRSRAAAGLPGRPRRRDRHDPRHRPAQSRYDRRTTRFDVCALAREVLTVPETLGADDLLAEMRRRGVREAIVIDEYGGTAGLVTFESLMERIVGDSGSGFGGAAEIERSPDGSARIDGLRSGERRQRTVRASHRRRRPIRQSAASCSGGWAAGLASATSIDVEGRVMRVEALEGIRVAKVWLSGPKDLGAQESAQEAENRA